MTFLLRHKVLFTQVSQIHRNVSTFKVPDFDLAKEKKAFSDVLPDVITSAVSLPKLVVPEIRDFVKEYMEYSLTDQIIGRSEDAGLELVLGYQILEKPENITEKSLYSVRVMGWCVELFQAYMFMVDDILDNSQTRFSKLCWHQLPNVGLRAINDGFLIHALMTDIIRENFGDMSHYQEILEVFEKTSMHIFMGQYLDCQMKTMSYENYLTICKYKTTPYFLCLPLQLILAFLRNNNLQMNEEITEICSSIGNYLQMKNDYQDVYGDEKTTGKVGTDIQEGKCSWLAVIARQRCNDAQREIFDQHYGNKEPTSVQLIKELYATLQMPEVYKQNRDSLQQDIVRRIDTLPLNRLKSYLYYKAGFESN